MQIHNSTIFYQIENKSKAKRFFFKSSIFCKVSELNLCPFPKEQMGHSRKFYINSPKNKSDQLNQRVKKSTCTLLPDYVLKYIYFFCYRIKIFKNTHLYKEHN